MHIYVYEFTGNYDCPKSNSSQGKVEKQGELLGTTQDVKVRERHLLTAGEVRATIYGSCASIP